ncbi:MAG: DNA primase [Fusobacteriota bacterium]
MLYKNEDIEKLIEDVDIVEVVSEYVDLKRSGKNYKGLCPFHDEKTPSFTVTPDKNMFKCFGCGKAGNAINFYQDINNLSFLETIEDLSKKYNYKLRPQKGNYQRKHKINKKNYEILEEANTYFKENLFSPKGRKAYEYLKKRGLDEKFIKEYNLGYSLDSWNGLYEYLSEKGYKKEDLLKLALIKKSKKNDSEYDTFRDRIIFPIYSRNGKIVGFGGRIITEDKKAPKYLNSPETVLFKKRENVYGLIKRGSIIRRDNFVLLMEGYMDVLTAHKYGFKNAVASLGTAFTEDQAKLLKKYTKNIVICYDMDNAGQMATKKASYILKRYNFNVKVLELSNAKDPDEFLQKNGKDQFVKELKSSKEIFDFLYDKYSIGLNLDEVISKKNIIEKFKEFFSNIKNEIEMDIYIRKLANNINLDKEAIKNELKPKINSKPSYNKFNKKKKINNSRYTKKRDKLERETVKIILKNLNYFYEFNDGRVKDDLYKKVMDVIKNNLNAENIISKIIQDIELGESEQEEIIELIYSVDDIEDEERYFEEIKETWERKKLEKKEKALKIQLLDSNLSRKERIEVAQNRVQIIKKIKNLGGNR